MENVINSNHVYRCFHQDDPSPSEQTFLSSLVNNASTTVEYIYKRRNLLMNSLGKSYEHQNQILLTEQTFHNRERFALVIEPINYLIICVTISHVPPMHGWAAFILEFDETLAVSLHSKFFDPKFWCSHHNVHTRRFRCMSFKPFHILDHATILWEAEYWASRDTRSILWWNLQELTVKILTSGR